MEPIEDRFYLLANGSLHMPAYKTSVDVEEFCIDYFAGEHKKAAFAVFDKSLLAGCDGHVRKGASFGNLFAMCGKITFYAMCDTMRSL